MLEVRNISFSWGRTRLLDDVSFAVAPGEVAVIAGANGAGKTSLMKVMAGLCMPSGGTVAADGVDIFANPLRYRRMIGYLPENAPADPDMTVRAYLRYRANLRGEMSKKIRHRVAEAIDLCGLDEHAGEFIGSLSFGLRKRVALADALLLRPRFLLLDDLLAGLDPVTRGMFGRILAAISSIAAVVVSGHEIDELARWATKFYVIKEGRALGAKTASGAKMLLGLAPPRAEGGAS
ncbi:MAG: ABC transporter ATP-binding protein [Kiritimatiellae bacterium]|nr:ABC transporter ATP-binding protein [Kiritimatiellia bacterium]